MPTDENTVQMPDPRVGLGAGLLDAEEAIWNLGLLSATPPPEAFVGVSNSDLAFKDNYVIQGNYNGFHRVGHFESGHAGPRDELRLPGVAERRVGLPEPAVRFG